MNKIIRPPLAEAGIVDKVIGWHSFRHSLATNLRSMGVDVKVAQELLAISELRSCRV
jgi:site-specific recombinase XerD